MLIIPAIDIQDGCVVRLVQGRHNKKVYSKDPVKTAKYWVKLGARLLHIVDLDGAVSGIPKNLSIVKEIAKSVSVPLQFGGGVRTIKMARELLDLGICRVVLGTRAVLDNKFLKNAFNQFKDKIVVSIDARADSVMISGWGSCKKDIDVVTFCIGLKDMGFKQIIYTDTLKDGTLSGPNIKSAKNLLRKTGLKLIASGGISSLEDIFKLKKLERLGLEGVIIGKALYEGKFTLSQALKLS
jgi:phosphoribosylformimino-5-aminoimidazole carboxamide ribotide isomerase